MSKIPNNSYLILLLFFIMFPLNAVAKEKPFKVPAKHVRVVTWNIKFLGRRKPLRTDEELAIMAKRIKGWDASVIALQEIQNRKRIQELVSLLGKEWKVNPQAGWTEEVKSRGETCLIWNTKKVKCLSYQTHDKGYSYKNRPPFSGVFLPLKKKSQPFVVISNHAYPGNSEKANLRRQKQGVFYRQLVLDMLDDEAYPQSILLVGDFNEEPGHPPHTTIQPESEPLKLHLISKSDKGGTFIDTDEDLDHIYVTDLAARRLKNDVSYVIRPQLYNETKESFDRICSDHLPVFIDLSIVK